MSSLSTPSPLFVSFLPSIIELNLRLQESYLERELFENLVSLDWFFFRKDFDVEE